VVISGEGVKEYYEKRGYREVDTFMVKDFWFLQVWFYYLRAKIIYYCGLVFNLIFCITILVLLLVLVLVVGH
jgi:hypothetical protein